MLHMRDSKQEPGQKQPLQMKNGKRVWPRVQKKSSNHLSVKQIKTNSDLELKKGSLTESSIQHNKHSADLM